MGLFDTLKRTADGAVAAVRRAGVVDKAVDKAKELIGEVAAGNGPSPRTDPWSSEAGDPFAVVEPRLFLTAAEMTKTTGQKFGDGVRKADDSACVMTYAAGELTVTLRAVTNPADRSDMHRRAAVVGSPIDWPGDWDQGVLAVAGDDAVGVVQRAPHVLEVRVIGTGAAAVVEKIHRATWLPARWP